jgi:hypothetical protein
MYVCVNRSSSTVDPEATLKQTMEVLKTTRTSNNAAAKTFSLRRGDRRGFQRKSDGGTTLQVLRAMTVVR